MTIPEMIEAYPLPWKASKTLDSVTCADGVGRFFSSSKHSYRDLFVDAMNHIGELRQEKDDLVSSYQSLQNDYVRVFAERDSLKVKVEELEMENDQYYEKWQEVVNDKSETDDINDRLNSRLSHCASQFGDFRREIKTLTTERDSLKTKVEELEMERDKLRKDYDIIDNQLDDNLEYISRLEREYPTNDIHEQRRFEIAIRLMPAYLEDFSEEEAAIHAVKGADCLLKEMMKTQENKQ